MDQNDYEYYKLVLAAFCAVAISIGFGRFAYTPILPQMQENLNLNSLTMGSIASWNYFGYLIGSIIPLFFSINKNLKLILILSSVMIIFTTFLVGITKSIFLFSFFRFITGISSALTFILGTSLIFSSAKIVKYKINLQSLPFAGIGLGILLGTTIIWLSSIYALNWQIQWIFVSFLGIIFCLPIFYIPINIDQKSSIETKLNNSDNSNFAFIFICLGYMFFGLGYIIFGTFISAMAKNTSELNNFQYLSWIIVGISAVPSVMIWQNLSKKIGDDFSLSLACLTTSLGIIFIINDNNISNSIMSCLLYGIGVPGSVALVLMEGKKRFAGSIKTSVAILTTLFSIGQISGPYIAGIIIDSNYGYIGSMYLSAICLGVSGILMINPIRYKFNF